MRPLAARIGFVLTTSVNFILIAGVLIWALAGSRSAVGLRTASAGSLVWVMLSVGLLCGATAFATMEILKRVFGLRGRYQQRQTRIWLRGSVAYDQLLDAMGADRASAQHTFNLPMEQLAALVSAAADVALRSGRHQQLVVSLSRLDPEENPSLYWGGDTGDSPEARDASAELAQRVRAGVDQLQISLGERWRRYVQSAVLWIAGAYGIAFFGEGQGLPGGEGQFVLAAMILGGPVAWILKDLAAVIERARR
jgi:hypothetical protein